MQLARVYSLFLLQFVPWQLWSWHTEWAPVLPGMRGLMKFFARLLIAVALWAASLQAADEFILTGCSFRVNPSEFLQAQARSRQQMHDSVFSLSRRQSAEGKPPPPVARRNFIDDEIFGRLEQMGTPAASPTTDEEFVRRIHLDLTGRIPSPADVLRFVSDASHSKRDELIERLLYSREFADRWAVWFADLIQATERLSTNARAPQIEGRNGLDLFLRDSFRNNKSVSRIVTELLTGTGNNYYVENGAANYMVLASTAMGPAQDTYDMMLSRAATSFLGMASYDCLLCHSGTGHLNGISLWGERTTRSDAQRMAAFFSRVRLVAGARGAVAGEHPLYNSTEVQDAVAGQYDLNTAAGNRPPRVAFAGQRNFTPEYRDRDRPASDENWRSFFAKKLTADPMFGRNIANRVWKHFMGLGLVDPVDTLDPDRLDPRNPPPAPWTFQATHPELLEKLAHFFFDNDTDLRVLIRLLVQSSAYQLSSRYQGEWKYEYVPLFARHYPRRLDAEEVHDAIVAATGVLPRYTWPMVNGSTLPRGTPLQQSEPVTWAMQLPDINEPRSVAVVRDFLQTFYRGNRDTALRLQNGSIQQRLALMNSPVVLDRIRAAGGNASPVLAALARLQNTDELLDELFLTFLSRLPTESERRAAAAHLQRSSNRIEALQDLAWACINKVDFLFSY